MTVRSVAYLVSQYPALSHAFIEREISALRARGVEVVPFSVRPAGDGVLGSADRVAADEVTVLKSGHAWRDHARLVSTRPRAYLQSLLAAPRVGRPGLRPRLWQLFYWAEAVALVAAMQRRGLRHVHVHFANNAADVARHATALGRAAYGGEWSWSLAMHGPTEFSDPAGHDLASKLAAASFVACISDYARASVLALAPTATTIIVRMGVDLGRYRPVDRRDHADPLRVLFVGRLVPEKGPADLVAALDGAANLELRLAGDGPLRHELPAGSLLGGVAQDQLPDLYAWADVFALPSYAEGLPVVLMEALATGLPVVTTPVAGIPELVVDGETGLLIEPGDRAALSAAIERLRDPALRERLGAAGRAAVLERHDAARAVEPLLAALS